MYEFEYFKCKFVRIESKINGLAEVKSASFFLGVHTKGPALVTSHSKNVPSLKVPSLNISRH